ncbi:unnamed protein product [Nippostrongylus brasiliensis]|uniref:Failed axon connections homolog (inferred by orthology to a human protein) n=1 Tax=Nippostrongylus brasiliensis TaxID=27835 RepID=A0A0N4YQ61_NIPBR|nr:unnamed protein product [Nippostrongylus brasiliensis]
MSKRPIELRKRFEVAHWNCVPRLDQDLCSPKARSTIRGGHPAPPGSSASSDENLEELIEALKRASSISSAKFQHSFKDSKVVKERLKKGSYAGKFITKTVRAESLFKFFYTIIPPTKDHKNEDDDDDDSHDLMRAEDCSMTSLEDLTKQLQELPNWGKAAVAGVVYLYQFPRTRVIPSPSAPCLKVETWLRMAEIPYEIDAAMFAVLAQIVYAPFDNEHLEIVKRECPNIMEYVERIKNRYWPDWGDATTKFTMDSNWRKRPKGYVPSSTGTGSNGSPTAKKNTE